MTVTSGCSCSTDAGIHGVTGPVNACRRISPFPTPGQQENFFFACKIEAMPMVIACLGTLIHIVKKAGVCLNDPL